MTTFARATTWTITDVGVPSAVGQPDAWALHGIEAVSREIEQATWGNQDTAYRAAGVLPRLKDQTYARRVFLVATAPEGVGDPTAVAGFALAIMPQQGNDHLAELEVWVGVGARRSGVGTALASAIEQVATQAGRHTLIAVTEQVGEADEHDADALVPPTGAGRIRSDDPDARFVLGRGYRLEQGERYSRLDLPRPAGALERLHAESAAHAGADYRPVHWVDQTPEDLVDGFAYLFTRMNTDVPLGELDIREDVWTAERVRTYERQVREGNRHYVAAGVVHEPTGTLVAMTLLEIEPDAPEAADQGDTIVLPEHRGHRLGMLVKTHMLLRTLPEVWPGVRRIHTWNAEENAHMLAINVALGFERLGVVGLWQKVTG